MKHFLIKHKDLLLVFAVTILPLAMSLKSIIIGSVPFWHDPARDLIQAWNNQTDPTLIGPPTGIEGIFYGPYWIWWLSFWQLFTKNPRFIILMSQTIPLLIALPLVWYSFKKNLDKLVLLSLWLLYSTAFINYTNFLWNPHLSLLFLLALILRLTQHKLTPKNALFSGVLAGLVGNFHMSIGLITAVSSVIFLAIYPLISKQNKLNLIHQVKIFACLLTGLLITLLPFGVFELRHDFLQTKTFLDNIQTTVIKQEAATNLVGITGIHVGQRFIGQANQLLHLTNNSHTLFVLFVSVVVIVFSLIKKKLSNQELLLLLFLTIFTTTLLFVYTQTNNPVWDYHFVGTEIIFICFLAIAASHSKGLKIGLIGWAGCIFLAQSVNFVQGLDEDALAIPSLESKGSIVEMIIKDADQTYQWEAYSNDWRTTDFEYLFRWLGQGDRHYDNTRTSTVNLKYLIIPVTSQDLRDDFINYKSSDQEFETVETWVRPDHTEVIKRVRRNQ